MLWIAKLGVLINMCVIAATLSAAEDATTAAPVNAGASGNPYQRWALGPSYAKEHFPIAVWMQDPRLAPRYRAAGINLYLALWYGPDEDQLATLRQHNMQVICELNDVGMAHRNDPLIVGWMHHDDPDLPHSFTRYWRGDVERIKAAWPDVEEFKQLGPGNPRPRSGGPPVPPAWTQRDYAAICAQDPQRPVLMCLNREVALENYSGRGVRAGKTEDYPGYLAACDIAEFEIFPVADGRHDAGLALVAKGVSNLRRWSNDRTLAWARIECTAVASPQRKPRPRDTRAEVWMSLIHGAMGVVYFVHQFNPSNIKALLDDPDMLAEVTRINQQIRELAPLLNSPSSATPATVASSNAELPVAAMTKSNGTAVYVFAVAMRPGTTTATITVPNTTTATVIVLGENRTIAMTGGSYTDTFSDWDVHLYEVKP
ncbi:MAG: hypothetical protein AAB263_08135 [Planctomycetota bacterium]